MVKKSNRKRPAPLGIHTEIDGKLPYTTRAWDILMAKYPEKWKDGFYHDSVIEQLLITLMMDKPADYKENELRDILGEGGIGQRISDEYFVQDSPVHVTPYKKRRKKGAPKLIGRKKKSLDYDGIGAELMHNFMRKSYEKVFPTQKDVEDFIHENSYLSAFQLEERIEEYISVNENGDDDEDDMRSGGLSEMGQGPEYRRSYILASLLLWKSTSTNDLQRAMEVLEDVEYHLKEEYDSWQFTHTMEEFREGGQEAFDEMLWVISCDIAKFCEHEIYETFVTLEDNMTISEDMVAFDFFVDIMMYLNPPRVRDKEKAFELLREKYKDICNAIEDDILGDFDEDGNFQE